MIKKIRRKDLSYLLTHTHMYVRIKICNVSEKF